MSQNMNGFPGLRDVAMAATAVTLTAGLAGCTQREAPPLPTIESSPAQTETSVPQNICDITTRERVAQFLSVASDTLSDGGCVSDVSKGITAHQTWRVDEGPLKGLTLGSFTTDETVSGPGSFSFSSLYETAPKGQQCMVSVEADLNECVTTDDAAAVSMKNEGVFTQLGFRDTFVTPSAGTTQTESFGDQLLNFTAATTEQLQQAPRATSDSKRPAKTDLSGTFLPSDIARHEPVQGSDKNLAPCALYDDGPSSCESVEPTAEIGFVNYSNTTGCDFAVTVDFGDGDRDIYNVAGNKPGRVKLHNHRYEKPGIYSIKMTSDVTKGKCTVRDTAFTFKLQKQATPATCENMLDEDRGRAYLYSTLPKGSLARVSGETANPFVYDTGNGANNLYLDDAGMKWSLLPEAKSKYHQPAGWDPSEHEGESLYRTFVSKTDSAGGSYKAVLMPDGATAVSTYDQLSSKKITYTQGNWRVTGHGMPTYNLVAPTPEGVVLSENSLNHLVADVFPHTLGEGSGLGDGRYVLPSRLVSSGLRTYREDMHNMRALIENGYRFSDTTNQLVIGTGDSRPVRPDQLWLARTMSDCAD